MKEEKIRYFEFPGKQNTSTVLKLAKEKADKLKIKNVILASTSGSTAERAFETFMRARGGSTLVIVGIERELFSSELIEDFESKGVKIRFSREVEYKYPDLAKTVLRRFCEGMKVAVEITAMAADAGFVRTDEDVVSIAGTGKGADTAIVIKPDISRRLFNMRIKKILAKPI